MDCGAIFHYEAQIIDYATTFLRWRWTLGHSTARSKGNMAAALGLLYYYLTTLDLSEYVRRGL